MSNPFSVTFGRTAEQYIPRIRQREQIVEDFNSPRASSQAYMIVGVRGSGKTVLLSQIEREIGEEWIRIDLNAQEDLARSLTSQLYAEQSMHKFFVKAKIDLSFLGIGLQIEKATPAYDDQTAITLMLKEISRQKRRVLVTIDEVANTDNMRRFAGMFQILTRNELPLYLIMAGTPENVFGLINDKKSTFLYRTPRVEMTPLNYEMIRMSYKKTLQVSEENARYLAHLTRGYPFAYQALGYVCWGKEIDPEKESFQDILTEYDYYLQELSYVKIWEEMSRNDRILARAIASGVTSSTEIAEAAGMDQKKYSVYRSRLAKKGIVDTSEYGKIQFVLPRFAEFISGIPA